MQIPDETVNSILSAAMYGESADLEALVTPELAFAHYTSADTALRIIKGEGTDRALWLRSATDMNDFSEIEFGQACLAQLLPQPEVARRLLAIGQALDLDVKARLFGPMDEERQRIKRETFLLSLAEHHKETTAGLLSMWRAYGGNSNVCMLFRTAALTTPQTAYDVDITKVDYGGPEGFKRRFSRVLDDIEANLGQLKLVDPKLIALNWKSVIDDMVLSTKHPSFAEEKEWRVIYRRKTKSSVPSPPSKVVLIGGVAQVIYYLPMIDVPDKGVVNATLEDLLERVIIGPTSNPSLVWEAFVRQLGEAGISNPERRVAASCIPLRR